MSSDTGARRSVEDDSTDSLLDDLVPYKYQRQGRKWAWRIGLFVSMIVVLFPIYWMLVTSITPSRDLFSVPTPLFPAEPTFQAYAQVMQTDIPLWFFNTTYLSVGVVTLTTAAATLGGYGLARLDIPHKKTFARAILFGYMFPPILLSIPLFIFWRQLGILNSIPGVIFATMAATLPFSLWLMWQFFQTVPYSLEESAIVSGSTRFRAFIDVALPMAKPGMIAVAIYSFALSWGAFTIPTILLIDSEKWVLVQGLYRFTVQESVKWSQIMAAATLMVLPTILFVYFLQKYILRGFQASQV